MAETYFPAMHPQVFSFWEALDNCCLFAFSALFLIVPCKQDHRSTSQSAKMPPNLGSVGLGREGGREGEVVMQAD